MAQDLTFVLKARNEAQRAIKSLGGDFDSVSKNASKLQKDTEEAAKATEALGENTQEAAAQTQELASQTEEVQKRATLAARAFGLLTKAASALGAVLGAIGASALTAIFPALLVTRLASIASSILLVVGAFAGVSVLVGAAQSARSFNAALAETSTLIRGTPTQLGDLTLATRELVREYGGTKTSQIQAFYQAISAGAASLPAATEIVTQANKLAVGGVTDVTTGVDILTTAINAYGPSTINAQQASDALFIAMQAGKTTIGELASELGNVIPLAVTTGVTFDELAGATSALTTQGITTNVAVTQLRGILQAVIKPTSEAAKLAKELSIEFNVAALRTKGLKGFLDELSDATGGSAEQLAQLFGSVEALGGVLALTGGGAQAFESTLARLAEKAGATDVAFEKVAQNLDARLGVATSSIAETFTRFGQVVLTVLVPAVEVFAKGLEALADNIDVVAIAIGLLGIKAIPTLIAVTRSAVGAVALLGTTTSTASKAMVLLRAALTGNIAALAAFGGGATRATLAVRFLGLALRAIPLLAVAGLITGVVRLFTSARDNAVRLSESVGDVASAFDALEVSLAIFTTNAGRAAGEALLQSSEAAIEKLKVSLADAQKELADAQFASDLLSFGTSLGFFEFETDRLREARDLVEELSIKLFDASTQASVAEGRIAGFDLALGGAAEQARTLAQIQNTVGTATFNTIPAVTELQAKYGEITGTVQETLRLTNELAIINGQLTFGNLLAESSAFLDNSSLSSDLVGRLNTELVALRTTDSMGDASKKALALAQEIIKSVGGVNNLDDATRQAVEKLAQAALQAANVDANARAASGAIAGAANNAAALAQNVAAAASALSALGAAINSLDFDTIGIQAQNRARGAGADAFATRRAGLLAQKEAELAPALKEGGFAAEVARTQLDNYTRSLDANLNASREAAAQQKALSVATKTVGAGGGGGGGGGGGASGAAAATSQLKDAVNGLTEAWRREAETVALTKRELEDYEIRQRLLQAAQADGIALSESVVQSVLKQRDAYEAAKNASMTFAAGMRLGISDFADSVKTDFEFIRETTSQVLGDLSKGLADFLKTGEFDVRSFIRNILGTIIDFMAQSIVKSFFTSLSGLGGGGGGLFGGGGGGGGLLGFLGGLFGGGRAEGGPVSPNRVYEVGERGRELFVPQTPGTIIPNNALRASAPAPDKAPSYNIVNVLDPALVGQFLTSPEGERAIMNVIRANQ